MSSAENPNLAHALRYIAAIERGATGAELAAFFEPDCELREYPNRLIPDGMTNDLTSTLAGAERGQRSVERQRYVVRNALAEGDRVALEIDWSATLKLPFGNTPPGGTLRAHFGVFITFRNGRILQQSNYDCYQPF